MKLVTTSVLVVVTVTMSACEHADVGEAAPDAATPPPDAGPPAPVEVTFYRDETPLAGADVVFHDPTGAPLVHTTLDAMGHAAADVPAGSAVTVILPPGPDLDKTIPMYTFLALEPGDHVRVGPTPLPSRTPLGTVSVTLPGAFPGATHYIVELGCEADDADPAAGPLELEIDAACVDEDGTFAAVASAYDAQFTLLATAAVAGLPAPPLGDGQAVLPAWRTDLAALDVVVTGAPADAWYVQADFVPFRGTVEFLTVWRQPLFGDGTVSLPYAPDAFDHYRYYYTLHFTDHGAVHIERGGLLPLPTQSLDVASDFLPRVRDVTVDVDAGARTPVVRWTVDGATAAVGTHVATLWKGAANDRYWLLMAPPDAASPLAYPTLPDALAQHRVAPDATELRASVVIIDSDLWPDAAAHRQRPFLGVDRPAVYTHRASFNSTPPPAP